MVTYILLSIIFILVVIIFIVMRLAWIRNVKYINMYDTFFDIFEEMRIIDNKKLFESDDEVGVIFKKLFNLLEIGVEEKTK